MTNLGKQYRMGDCVLAANEYNQKNGGDYLFCVMRMLLVAGGSRFPGDKSHLVGSLPAAFFKEPDSNGNRINSHCFLRARNGCVLDPMFGIMNVGIDTYLVEVCKRVQLTDNHHVVLFDIQTLREKHRLANRSQFVASDPVLLAAFTVDTTTGTVQSAA